MENYALIDNNLASAQKAIGQSSNLAQLALTYTYNFNDKKFDDYVCILSVVAQIAIDNAKRSYDIDLTNEIARIKSDMEIKNNKYPAFWELIRKDFNSNAKDKAKNEKQVIETELVIENPDIDYQELKMQADLAAKEVFDAKTKINTELICPMNYICNIKIKRAKRSETIPMDKFFIKHPLKIEKRKCKKVEELIQKYSLLLYSEYQSNSDDETDKEQYLLLRSDFEQLISDIHALNLSKNYLDLMSWLIDRAFIITSSQKRNKDSIKNNTANNKVILLKALYSTNPKTFLQCFVEGKNQA